MILIVDDEPGVLHLCQRLLERAGYTALTASNSTRAVELLNSVRSERSEPFELLLADIRMPGVGGFQLMDTARQIFPDLAVVLMTGFGTVDVAIEALHRGADGLILKPFEGAELVKGVESALQENQRRQDSIRLRVLRPLFDIAENFFSETHPERLRSLILGTMCQHLGTSLAGLCFPVNSGTCYMQIDQGELRSGGELGTILEALAAITAKRGKSLRIDVSDPQSDLPQGIADGLAKSGLQYICSIPLLKYESGLIVIAGRGKAGSPFRDTDYEMMGVLGQEAAAALENARLYAELRASLEKLELSQKALLQAEKIATAGRLTASIAHEINNPLQALNNCLDLAGRSELPLELREKYLQVAKSELDRLVNTVQRMLDLFRPGAKERQWTQPDLVIRHVLTLLEPQMRDHQIRVVFHPPEAVPPILAVTSQIQQVILNILLNAVEAMPDGGDITIALNGYTDQVEISIEDTGPGIPEKIEEHLFEAFSSNKPSGTGLGLAVSYGIVQAHGGNLEFIPNQEKGARFRITLPKGTTQ